MESNRIASGPEQRTAAQGARRTNFLLRTGGSRRVASSQPGRFHPPTTHHSLHRRYNIYLAKRRAAGTAVEIGYLEAGWQVAA